MPRLDLIWKQLFPAEQQRIVRFRPNGIEMLALELHPETAAENVEEAVA